MSLLNSRLKGFLPDNFDLSKYPALTVGIIPFTLILLIIDTIFNGKLSHLFSLYPYAPLNFDLNRLSFYILYHQNLIHWGFNILALAPSMYHFEATHGTVHTGVTLNLLAVSAALQYCILGLVLYRHTQVIGLSGIVFLFMSYFSVKEHDFKPVLYSFPYNNRTITIPTKYSPFITLFLLAIFIPGSSFWGHLAGISSGYLLAYGKLKVLYPPLKVILFIENKLQKLIKLLDGVVDFVSEEDGINLRSVAYKPIFTQDTELVGVTTAADTTHNSSFRGDGHVLGA